MEARLKEDILMEASRYFLLSLLSSEYSYLSLILVTLALHNSKFYLDI